MPKKIFELAKDFNMKPLELVENLKSNGFTVRNHMTELSDEQLEKVMELFKSGKEGKDEVPVKKKTVKKRKAVTKKKTVESKVVATKGGAKTPKKDEDDASKKTTIRKKTVIRRKPSEEQVDDENVTTAIDQDQVVMAEERQDEVSQTEQEISPEIEAGDKSHGLRVVARPENKEETAISDEPEKKQEQEQKSVYREKVHKFTPVYIPPKKEKVEKKEGEEAGVKAQKKTGDGTDESSTEQKATRKRMGGLASIMSGKVQAGGVTKSQQIVQQRAEAELKSYAALSGTGKPLYTQVKRKKFYVGPTRDAQSSEIKESKRVIYVHKGCLTNELAHKLGVKFKDLADQVLDINLLIKPDDYVGLILATEIVDLYNYRVEDKAFDENEILGNEEISEEEINKLPLRDPIVTIMGHVDHGKTTLLDYIRDTKVVQGEAGGITQHVGAYQVEVKGRSITFLDTPGHAAFSTIRQRGAQVTDIVVLIVSADDGIMPQTIESIKFCRESEVPVIVAINKIDKEGVNLDRIKTQLADYDLAPEEWGGQTQCVPISALKGDGVDELLESIMLQAEIMDLRAETDGRAEGVVIEARVEQGRGPVATILIQKGTLKKGDSIVVGESSGRARNLMDHLGEQINKAVTSQPVQILGLNQAPQPGDDLHAVKNERVAKKVVANRIQERKDNEIQASKKTVSLEDFFATYSGEGEEKKILKLIVRSDVQGSYEAIKGSLEALDNNEVGVQVIGGGVGAISDSDVMLAGEAKGFIIGFNMRPITSARRLAVEKGVDIKTYSIIYELINDVKFALEGILEPEFKEVYIGRAEVRDTFAVPKIGTIAGSLVIDGKIKRGCKIRLLRQGKIVFDGLMSSLKRFKDDVKEVNNGYECGIGLENFNDIKLNDVFEAYVKEERKRSLDEVGISMTS